MYSISPAVTDDFPGLASLLNDTALFLIRKGIHQWKIPFDETILLREISRKRIYLVRDEHYLSGTFSIKNTDYFWPSQNEHATSSTVYFYRYAIRAENIGKKLGHQILPSIEDYLYHQKGIRRMRLDCWAGNEKLKKYYSNSGYQYTGDYPENDYFISLFEKNL